MSNSERLKASDLFKNEASLPKEQVITWLQEKWNATPSDLAVLLPFIAERLLAEDEQVIQQTSFKNVFEWFVVVHPSSKLKIPGVTWTIPEIAELFRKEWFHGFLPKVEEGRRLAEKPDGTFLLRCSSIKGDFVISMIANKKLYWWKLGRQQNGTLLLDKPKSYKYEFTSLEDVYNQLVAKKVTLNDAPCSPSLPCLQAPIRLHHLLSAKETSLAIIPEGELEILENRLLGNGFFGTVYEARYQNFLVAAKKPKKQDTPEELSFDVADEFIKEIAINSIAEFLGVYLPKKYGAVPFLVTRLYTLGNAKDLLEFEYRLDFQESKPRLQLLKEKFIQLKFYPLTPLDLVIIAKDAAAGMSYLQSVHIIHRDLACRNLLLEEVEDSSEDEKRKFVVKVSDFGLARSMGNTKYNICTKLKWPLRWIAPEVLKDHCFFDKSDVWSFGCMLYEIFENGKNPYPEQENSEIKSYLMDKKDVRKFFALGDAPDGIQEILNECLEITPQNRPTFKQLHDNLHSIELKLRDGVLKNERKHKNTSYVRSNSSDATDDGYYKDEGEYSGAVDQGYE